MKNRKQAKKAKRSNALCSPKAVRAKRKSGTHSKTRTVRGRACPTIPSTCPSRMWTTFKRKDRTTRTAPTARTPRRPSLCACPAVLQFATDERDNKAKHGGAASCAVADVSRACPAARIIHNKCAGQQHKARGCGGIIPPLRAIFTECGFGKHAELCFDVFLRVVGFFEQPPFDEGDYAAGEEFRKNVRGDFARSVLGLRLAQPVHDVVCEDFVHFVEHQRAVRFEDDGAQTLAVLGRKLMPRDITSL